MKPRSPLMILTLLFCVVTSPALAQIEMTLHESTETAISTSPLLAQSKADLASRQHQAKAAGAAKLPSLGLNGSYSWVSETMELNIPILPQPISFGDNTSYDMQLAVRAPLYAGGSLSSQQKALQQAANASRYQTESDSLIVLLQVRSAYFRAQMAQAKVDAVAASHKRLTRHKTELERMRDVGMADEEGLLELRAAIAEVEQKAAAATAQLQAARLELGRLTGHPGEEVIPADSLDTSLLPPGEEFAHSAQNRPDLTALRLMGRSLHSQVSAQKGSFLPTVTAEAAYHYGKPGVDMIANEAMSYATTGVRLSWTLYDFGRRSQQVQAATMQRRSLDQKRIGAEQMWTTKLAASLKQLDASRTETAAAKERFSLQQKRYTLLEGKLAQGQASESSLLDAEDDLTLAELDLARTMAGERLTEAEVLYALGR